MSITDYFVDDIIARIFHDNDKPEVYTGPPPVPDPNAPRPLSKEEKQKRMRAAYREQQRAARQFWDPLYGRWFWG